MVNEVDKTSSLEGGGLRNVREAGRRVFDWPLNRLMNLSHDGSVEHLSLRHPAEYSPRGEIFEISIYEHLMMHYELY